MNMDFPPCFGSIPSLFSNPLGLLGGIVLLCLAAPGASAQSVTFAGAQSVFPTTGLDAATGVAVDSSGNVVISDFYNQRAVVLAKTPTGYEPQATLPAVGLGSAYGIAVDVAGNVFIPDCFNHRIVELPKTTTGYGAQITLPGMDCEGGGEVALDLAGDVFTSGDYGDFNSVAELPWTGTGYEPQIILPASGLNSPNNLAVDAAGDVFIMDAGNNRVVELRRTPTGYGPQITLPFTGLSEAYGGGVAVDSAGDNVIVVDTDNNRVLERQMGGYGPQITLLSGLNFPRGVFVDGAGTVFVADQNNNRVLELQTRSVNLGGANVCASGATTPAPCSQTLTLNFNVNADATLGYPEVHTGGVPDLDFKLAKGSTCRGAVTAGSTCTVNVTFQPLTAGLRNGSVQLTDGGAVIASTDLSGFGVAATTGASVPQLSSTYLPFGAVALGEIKTLPLIIANVGGGTLTLASSISGSSDYAVAANTCGPGVTPGTSCTLVVEFAPTTIDTHDGLLTLDTNAGDLTVKLHGTATGLSTPNLTSDYLPFGSVSSGSSEVILLNIRNVGLPGTVTVGTAITVRSTTHPTTTYKVLTTSENTCLAGITIGQTCALPIEFAPTSSGIHDDLLSLSPFPGSGATTVWLNGSTP